MPSNHSWRCRNETEEAFHTRDPGVSIINRQEPFVSIARITRTQGRFGAVRVQIEFEEFRLFEAGRHVILTLEDRKHETTIEDFRNQHGRWVLKLEGLESISDAETWIGGRVMVAKEDIPPKKAGSFYDFELKGCTVFADGESIGTVREVFDYSGSELLSVDKSGEEILIPFVKAYLKKVDPAAKRIELDLPAGLIDLNQKGK